MRGHVAGCGRSLARSGARQEGNGGRRPGERSRRKHGRGSARQRRHDTVFNVHGAFHRDVECKEVFRVRRREPPTPYGRDPGRRGVRSPGTGGRCGPFGTDIRHPVPPPQSPTRRPPRQLPVSAVKARQCPRLRPSAPRPCTFGHHAPPGRSSETVIRGAGTRQLTAAGPRKWHSGVTRRNPLPKGRAAGGVMGHRLTPTGRQRGRVMPDQCLTRPAEP